MRNILYDNDTSFLEITPSNNVLMMIIQYNVVLNDMLHCYVKLCNTL